MFRKRSWLIDKQQIEFSGRANYRSKYPNDFSEGANYRSKIRGESSREANYRSKNRADQNKRCHENAGKFRRNIVSSEISSKSQEFHQNSFALLLHNTVLNTFYIVYLKTSPRNVQVILEMPGTTLPQTLHAERYS